MGGTVQVPFGGAMVTRMCPAMGADAYKTYSVSAPLRTHWRPATCEETECDAYRFGWVSTFDTATDLGARQYEHCRHDRTRDFHIQRVGLTVVKFVYKPGNRCFRSAEHRAPIGMPPRYLVAGGDFRGNPRGTPLVAHRTAMDWVDDCWSHQDKLATAIQRG